MIEAAQRKSWTASMFIFILILSSNPSPFLA